MNPKLEGVDTAVVLGESGGVGCSTGLIDRSIPGSLRSRLSGISTCRGDSCRFPVIGEGCELAQLGGPSLLTNGSSSVRGCLGNGVVQIGGSHGNREDEGMLVLVAGTRDVGSGISSGVGDLLHGVGITGVASLCGGDGVSD